MPITRDAAEALALQCLAWIAGNEELMPVFLGATGASGADLRARAAEPEFLASLLDFLMMDDTWVVDATQAAGVPPERLAEARAMLPGGDLPNWT